MPWPFLLPKVIIRKLSFSLSLGIIAADCFSYIVTNKDVTSIIAPEGCTRIGLVSVRLKNIIVRHWVYELPINQRLKT